MKKTNILATVTIIVCGAFIFYVGTADCAVGSSPSQKVKGQIVAFLDKDITISIPQNAQVAIGDSVTVSFMAGDEPIPYGEWKVSKVNSNGTIEAVPSGEVEQPSINLDAIIHVTKTNIKTTDMVPTAASRKTPSPFNDIGVDWSGKWNTAWGVLTLHQEKNHVTGSYPHRDGKIEGRVEQSFLNGTWQQSESDGEDKFGDIQFLMSSDSNFFTGKWRYGTDGNWDGEWNGTRLQEEY